MTLNDSGRPGLEHVLALDDRLVHARAAGDVVGLDRQHLLQRVGGAVGLERPHLHLAETLAAELRLAAERLLRDERVRARRAGVDLVVDQVVQLHHVHDADGDLVRERLAGAAVEETASGRSAGSAGPREQLEDLLLGRAVEHRRRRRGCRAPALRASLTTSSSLERVDELADLLGGVELLQLLAGAPSTSGRPFSSSSAASLPRRARAPPSRGGSRGSGRRSCGTARRAGSARCRPACRRRGTACPPRAGCARARPCCRGGRPSCRRPAACA